MGTTTEMICLLQTDTEHDIKKVENVLLSKIHDLKLIRLFLSLQRGRQTTATQAGRKQRAGDTTTTSQETR